MGTAKVREMAKVGSRGIITIPASLRKAINIHPGDVVVIEAGEDGTELTIRPQLTVDRSQAWFWSENWQKNERYVERDISAGKVKRVKAKEALKELGG
jgi:AbrB family looped-hinge helix DNA binding protein